MVKTYALSAAVVAGGLMLAAGSPASAAPASASGLAKLDGANLNLAQGEIMNVGWRGRRWRGGGYYFAPRAYYYRPRAYYYRPRYYAPRYYRAYRTCWINSWGYRVCG